jgi:hypothetical protein
MRASFMAALLPILGLVAAPGAAFAGTTLTLNFTGTASPGFNGDVFTYGDGMHHDTSFAGQPVNISLQIADYATNPYVSNFSVSWSNQTYTDYPYLTSWTWSGLPQSDDNDFAVSFYSSVSLTDTGGSISIFPTSGFISALDGDFNLDLTYQTGSSHPVGSIFTDTTTGGGTLDLYLTDTGGGDVGPHDAESNGPFTLASVHASVPEPAAWSLMILGFGALGVALRRRRAGPLPA